MGAILAVPDGKGEYLVIRDLSKLPAKGKKEDLAKIKRIFWVDEKSESVKSLSKALQLKKVPPHIVAFFPEKLEKKLLKLELKYKGLKEEEIRETVFKIVKHGEHYEPEVAEQKPKKPAKPPGKKKKKG